MARKESYHLMDMLAEVIDPRNKKGLRHPLRSILGLLVVGFMCGHKGYTSIAAWTRTQPQLTKALGFTRENPPCAAT
ncbi:transposase family protein, partial [Candidatus Poribacteria bacterium]|nr:transposase family protein [Candidatus Poribacteria bacterium]